MSVQICISIGEFYDRVSILQIKQECIKNEEKLCHVNNELKELFYMNPSINFQESLLHIIKPINKTLWEIEDKIRIKERNQEFDDEFIQLARSVYITNDKRSVAKQKINVMTGSKGHEIKSYVRL